MTENRRIYLNEWSKQWRAKNPDRWKAIYKKSYTKHRQYHLDRRRTYGLNNPGYDTERKLRASAKKHRVTIEDCQSRVVELLETETCFWCGIAFRYAERMIDHVIPMSRGGGHVPDNLVAACRHCNTSKNRLLPSEWVEEKQFRKQMEVGT